MQPTRKQDLLMNVAKRVAITLMFVKENRGAIMRNCCKERNIVLGRECVFAVKELQASNKRITIVNMFFIVFTCRNTLFCCHCQGQRKHINISDCFINNSVGV